MEQAKGEADAGIGFFDGGEKKPNQRVWCFPNKGQEFIELLNNKTIDDFVPEFLGDDAILFSYTANIARPGNTPCTCTLTKSLFSHRSGSWRMA